MTEEVAMAGRKTHEQQLRTLERKADVPDARQTEEDMQRVRGQGTGQPPHPEARQSEFPVSRQGVHQESEHNKHNDPPRGAPKH